jgi:hypothetical protein
MNVFTKKVLLDILLVDPCVHIYLPEIQENGKQQVATLTDYAVDDKKDFMNDVQIISCGAFTASRRFKRLGIKEIYNFRVIHILFEDTTPIVAVVTDSQKPKATELLTLNLPTYLEIKKISADFVKV